MIKYFSMFSGVGGFELGIGSLAECIGYSEIDKYAITTYERHYKHDNFGDATLINERELPDFDLLVGGFPCQAFSIAGKRKGFDDTRGTLFFDIARIIKHKRPRHIFLENVQGLLSHDSGKTFQTILGVLADLGYGVEWQVLNGKRWVPQNRVRVVIIGHLRGKCGRKIFPFQTTDQQDNGELASTAIDANYFKGIDNHGQRTAIVVKGYLDTETWRKRNESIRRFYSPDGIAPTTPTGTGGGVMTKIAVGSMQKNAAVMEEMSPTLPEAMGKGGGHTPMVMSVLTPTRPKRQNGRRMKNDGKPSFTLNTQDQHGVFDGVRIRRLTPLECERLMGWPDNWTEGVSDTQRYKQCGNGIIAPMVTEVITALCNEGCLQEVGIA